MYLNTPTKISFKILELCREINPKETPVYVSVIPVDGAEFNECFGNVDKKITSKGGEKIHGWVIREWKDTFLEAEFHAVWKSPKGSLIDVSPTKEWEDKRLFLPEPTRVFNGNRIGNIRKPLRFEPVIINFFDAHDEWRKLFEKHSAPGYFGPVSLPKREAAELDQLKRDLQFQILALPPIDHKAPCYCGSGKKYRNCCGR